MTVNIVGSGKVARHLLRAFSGKVETAIVNPHSFEGLVVHADVTLICVSDNAIREVGSRLPSSAGIIAHTSGSIPLDALAGHDRYGVFYPLQTFSENSDPDYSIIPFFIEGSEEEVEKRLATLASLISKNVMSADSDKRKSLHLASVFACNFANHLWALADSILKKNGMDFNVLRPLLEETLLKTKTISPHDAQTGPAVRNDTEVIGKHLAMLENEPGVREIYRILTDSIRYANNRANDTTES